MTEFARTVERLEMELDQGMFTRGAQVTVHVGDERVLDLALGDAGLGTPMTPEHILRVYCTIKPFLAVAVARLVEQGVVTLDEPLEARLPGIASLADGVTLRHILTHTAGLHTLRGLEMELVQPARRRSIVERVRRPVAWRVGLDAAYSEYGAWNVVGFLVEELTDEPLREHLRTNLIEPLGLHDTYIGMTPEEFRAVLPRLGVNHDMRDLHSIPMLFERTERVATETNPAHGGYTNARDLATFYEALLARLDGDGNDALPSPDVLWQFVSTVRVPVYDQVLDRVCPYGLGFMTELDQHAFGDACSESSFGHSGNVGSSFAFTDPDRNLAVGVVFNGLVGHDMAFLRRRALLRALYLDLDELEDLADAGVGAEDDVLVEAADAPRKRGGFLRRRRREE
jgi:CubicO group peptidase (beta-lactamase class C family)